MTRQSGCTSRRGFTIIEGLTVAGVIILLLSLTMVAATRGLRHAKISSERHHLSSIKLAIEQFERQHEMLPPLVDDQGGPLNGNNQPKAFTKNEMTQRTSVPVREQYSIHSIPYYVMGLLDVEHNGKPIDGATGPAITKVRNDDRFGEFSQRGAPVPAVFTGGDDARRVYRDPDNPEQIVYLDQWGVRSGTKLDHAIRYYRWEMNTRQNPQLPPVLGVSTQVGTANWVIEDVELRSARYAIVSAGPDGQIDDENHDAAVNKDNIVEVGR